MTELWLIRHGQTDWNIEGRFQGQTDLPLNPQGAAQAEMLAQQFLSEGIHFAAVYSSDLLRARTTAETLARRLGIPLYTDARLREAKLGEWEGKLFSEIKLHYPDWLERRKQDPAYPLAPGGENLIQIAERLSAAAREIARIHEGQRVLVVSHGLSLAVLICLSQGEPLNRAYWLIPQNAEPVVVQWSDGLS
jgi:broad specificity phosphatase PhoE